MRGEMKIFLVSWFGNGGCEYTLAEALRSVGHAARSARWAMNYLDFPVDVLCPTDGTLAELWEWADVVVCIDYAEPPVTIIRRPLVKLYTGTGYRENFQQFDAIDARLKAARAAATIDLCHTGATWLPLPIPDLSGRWQPAADEFWVAHAPTNRAVKQTDRVIAELGGVEGVSLVVIEWMTNAECLERKAKVNAFVDQFGLGYGTNAAEAWSLGMPVVADGAGWIIKAMEQVWGRLPFIQPLPSLRGAVERLRDDPVFYREAALAGRDHWRRFHSPEVVGARLVKLAQEAMELYG